eukprot:GSA120T00025259001.1
MISMLQLFTPYSPTAPYATVVPLSVIVLVTAIKDAIEDYRRYQSDRRVNGKPALVVGRVVREHADSTWETNFPVLRRLKWEEIQVGHVVYLEANEAVPADVLLLSSSDADAGLAYVETAQLDGESNLKTKAALLDTKQSRTLPHLIPLEGMQLQCEPPSPNLERFYGTYRMVGALNPTPVDMKNLLLRGSTLRNTDFAFGVVLYTGHETRQFQNSNRRTPKRSRIEKQINTYLGFVFLLMAGGLYVCNVMDVKYKKRRAENFLQLEANTSLTTPYICAAYLILYNNLVPVSMAFSNVTFSTHVKFGQALLLARDQNCWHTNKRGETEPAECRASALSDDMGQIDMIFSDKISNLSAFDQVEREFLMQERHDTDLKESVMLGLAFQTSWVIENLHHKSGVISMVFEQKTHTAPRAQKQAETARKIAEVVHGRGADPDSVVPGSGTVEAKSPDEEALLHGIADLGYKVLERSANELTVLENGHYLKWEILGVHEFTSDRRRMSIVLREKILANNRESYINSAAHGVSQSGQRRSELDQRVVLFMKGADSVMLERAAPDTILPPAVEDLSEFSVAGLRTLVMGRKYLTAPEANEYIARMKEASAAVMDREEMLEAVADWVERDVELLGCSGLEDRLQQDVTETIGGLLQAGIKVWMLTGDKQETAVNVGKSVSLVPPNARTFLFNLTDKKNAEEDSDSRTGPRQSGPHDEEILQRKSSPASPADAAVDRGGPSSSDAANCRGNLPPPSASFRSGRRITTTSARSLAEHFSPATASQRKMMLAREHSLNRINLPALKEASVAHTITATSTSAATDFDASTSPRPMAMSKGNKELSRMRALFIEHTLDVHRFRTEHPNHGYVLVIDGPSAAVVLEDQYLTQAWLKLCAGAASVIACRVTPKQKATFVTLMRSQLRPEPLTLAIGDGANDVAMIKAAHVGVGISGNEGRQALSASDYSIGQFRFLRNLLFVHGRANYNRVSLVILFSFFKNVMLIVPVFFYNFQNGWSGASLYESYLLMSYNLFWTSLPILVAGLCDTDLPDLACLHVPELYQQGRLQRSFNSREFLRWMVQGIVTSTALFWFHVEAFGDGSGSPLNQGWLEFGSSIFYSVVLLVNARLFLATNSCQTNPCFLLAYASTVLFIPYWCMFDAFLYMLTPPGRQKYVLVGSSPHMWLCPRIWLSIFLSVSSWVLLEHTRLTWASVRNPTPVQHLRGFLAGHARALRQCSEWQDRVTQLIRDAQKLTGLQVDGDFPLGNSDHDHADSKAGLVAASSERTASESSSPGGTPAAHAHNEASAPSSASDADACQPSVGSTTAKEHVAAAKRSSVQAPASGLAGAAAGVSAGTA